MSHRPSFWVALAIILAAAVSVALILLRLVRLPFVVVDVLGARNSLTHWAGWAGSLTVLAVTAWYVYRKRVRRSPSAGALRLHAFGNLVGFLLVSIHFAQQVSRSPANYPELGTGVVQYAAVVMLVLTGFTSFFAVRPGWASFYRFLHPAAALTLLMSIILHIIHVL
jgi:hypothetical protein